MCKYFVCHVSTSAARVVALKQVYLQKCEMKPDTRRYITSASKSSIRRFVIMEKAPTRAFPWLKEATTTFTFKTLLRHYAKWALTPRSLNVKLGPRRNYHKGRAAIRHYAKQPARPSLLTFASRTQFHVEGPWGQRPFSIVS